MIIREANSSDAKQIQEINSTSLGYQSGIEDTEKRIKQVLTRSEYMVLVAELDQKVVGYIQAVDYISLYSKEVKNVMALAVDVAYQGRGIGKALLQGIERWAKEEGAYGIRLSSGEDRVEAHGFYEHCGYTLRKRQKNFSKKI